MILSIAHGIPTYIGFT